MLIDEQTIKDHTNAIRQNTALLKKLLEITEKKSESRWAQVSELKRYTNWKDHLSLRKARNLNLVDFRYIKVNGVDSSRLEYDLASIHQDYKIKLA